MITNETGNLIEKVKYYPYGEIKSKLNEFDEKYLFTRQELDGETGLYYYGARYYSPEIRRFVQPDDIIQDAYNPQTLNRYSYVLNNPVKYDDPDGHIVPALVAAAVYVGIQTASGFIEANVEYAINHREEIMQAVDTGDISTMAGYYCDDFEEEVVSSTAENIKWNIPTAGLGKLRFVGKYGDDVVKFFKGGDNVNDLAKAKRLKIQNKISGYKNVLDKKTLEAAKIEKAGGSVGINPKTGKPWDHVQKVEEAQKGLSNYITRLENRINYEKTPQWEREVIREQLENAKKLLDESKNYVS